MQHAAGRSSEFSGRWLRACLVSCAITLAGCAGTRIPADWPLLAEPDVKGACTDITGQFSNSPVAVATAESSDFHHTGASGAYWFSANFERLAGLERADHEGIKYLTILRDDKDRMVILGRQQESGNAIINIVLVRSGSDVEAPEGINAPVRTFDCEDGFTVLSGFMWLPISPFPHVAFMGVMGSQSIRMRKAADGSLIVRAVSKRYATTPIYPIPIMPCIFCGRDYDEWQRYAAYRGESAGSAPATKVEMNKDAAIQKREGTRAATLPAPNEEYLECVKRGTGKCDEYVSCFSGGQRQWTNKSKCD